MKRQKKSSVYSPRRIAELVRQTTAVLRRDMITVYAAQASFFLLLASVPFLMLLLNVGQRVFRLSKDVLLSLIPGLLPAPLTEAFSSLAEQLSKTGSIPLLSVSAVTALWSASRGMAALERGLSGVYGVNVSRGFFRDVLRSLLYTLALLFLIFASLVLLVFGGQIAEGLISLLPALERPLTAILGARSVFVFFGLTGFFALEHRTIVRHIPILPGAALSAAGWMLFSFLYSLYVQILPRASYLYGGLSVLAVWMLWLYACMIIFLLGAEANKLLRRR